MNKLITANRKIIFKTALLMRLGIVAALLKDSIALFNYEFLFSGRWRSSPGERSGDLQDWRGCKGDHLVP